MPELTRKAVFFLAALPAVLRAALRLAWLDRRHGLQELADRLRAVAPLKLAYLANPGYLDGSVSRLLGFLPPRRLGPCLKRSFLLLDLWSRCGLEPTIHIGTLEHDGERRFHAWVSVAGGDAPAAADGGYAEIWSY